MDDETLYTTFFRVFWGFFSVIVSATLSRRAVYYSLVLFEVVDKKSPKIIWLLPFQSTVTYWPSLVENWQNAFIIEV